MIDKKRLIQLIKLANHNNSEGEANSAARRVCKMIEEDKFNIINGDPSIKPPREKPFTYADVRRSAEPEFKSTPPNRPEYNPFKGFEYKEEFTDEDLEDLLKNIRKVKFHSPYTFYGGGRAGKSSWVNDIFTGAHKSEKPNRLLKCQTCGKESFTKFQGRDDFYECVECWNPINRKEPK